MGPSQAMAIKVQSGQHGRCDSQWIEGTEEVGAEAGRGHFCRLHGSPDIRCRLADDDVPPRVRQQVCGYQAVVACADDDRIGRAFLISHSRRRYRREIGPRERAVPSVVATRNRDGSLLQFDRRTDFCDLTRPVLMELQ